MKYIDSEKLKVEIKKRINELDHDKYLSVDSKTARIAELHFIDRRINSLQQEQSKDLYTVIKEYYGEEPPFEEERTKTAYYFFSAGRSFELKKIEEERAKHITDLLDNYQKGKKAGYKKAISELKEEKIECSPVMKELIDKLFRIGNAFNFGFSPKNFLQEQSEVDLEKEIKDKYSLDTTTLKTRAQYAKLATYFYELGQCEMRNRITNPEYNKQVVERMKSEHPIAASEEELKKAIKERYPMPEDADAHTRDRIAAARNGFLSGYSYELDRKEIKNENTYKHS